MKDKSVEKLKENKNPYVIGIGTSAGGLQALTSLFNNIPEDSVSYVVVQHLAPDQTSFLTDYLNRKTVLKIEEIQDDKFVEINRVYVLPPGKQVIIADNVLRVSDRQPNLSAYRTIDAFFTSLAADKGDRAIGIILSGTGNDGTEGIAAIKKAGGLVLVQDPDTAKFDGMPRNAISTGNVDFILPPELMPDEIFNFVKVVPLTKNLNTLINGHKEETLNQILSIVHERTGIDFSNYKRPTIIRRISRRMAITNTNHLVDYLDYLHLHPEEVETISKEFLIGVTQFFRDREAFEVLQDTVIPELFSNKGNSDQLRIWVAGCSTGEEPYSLAIAVREYMEQTNRDLEVKIFASDIDRDALEYASRAMYSMSSLTDVSEERLTKYFQVVEDKYQIVHRVRKMVIFAPHNIISDPPFSKMDMVSCRNMLIYLNPLLQKKVMAKFHYALNEGGYLFLGSSESVGDLKNFVEVNKKWKIFRNAEPYRSIGLETFTTAGRYNQPQLVPLSPRQANPKTVLNQAAAEALSETLLEEFNYAAVYIDENFELLQATGDYNHFLNLPDKTLTLNILKMVPSDLSPQMGTWLRKVIRDKEKLNLKNVRVQDKGIMRQINLVIKPYLDGKRSRKFIIVLFSENGPSIVMQQDSEKYWYEVQNEGRITELEIELQHTKEDLQSVVEELETANEELQSTNEELLSSNEELQSTNEELQSLNEELHTINTEHQYKIKFLMELEDDLNNYFRSTNISQIFLDRNLDIRKYTPAATRQINLIESDIGRSIYHISNNLRYPYLVEDIRRVIANQVNIEKEVQDTDGFWYQMRIQPYISQEGRIDGAIVIFIEINELKNLHLLHTGILDSSGDMIQAFKAVRNQAGEIIDLEWTLLNLRAQEYLKRQEHEVVGRHLLREFSGFLRPDLFQKLVQVIETGNALDVEIEQDHNFSPIWLHVVAVKLE
ncbi:MAG: PAS domain-containing protein, partial [Bacteroidota bacterium]|nr:PAS domain-containing protein [Bacteroidota bacterium]